jgi:hypothetical protein
MYTYMKTQYAILLSVICIGALPAFAFGQRQDPGMPDLPQPIELEGRVQDVEAYDCNHQHRYWCGRIAGIVWINADNGEVVARYLKRDTTMILNGNATFFEGIKRGDKARIIYFKDDVWASSLELERTGS